MRKNILSISVDKALALSVKTTALSMGVTALSLGIKTVALSVGAGALSLGLSFADLDTNQAQAAAGLNNVNSAGVAQLLNAANVFASAGTFGGTTSIVGWGTDVPTMYASEIFGANSASTILPSGDSAAVFYQIDGKITATFNAKFTLDNGAVFASTPKACLDAEGAIPLFTGCTVLSILEGDKSTAGGGSGKNFVVFQVNGSTNGVDSATDTDNIVMVYSINSASALATPGAKIQMTAALATPEPGYPVNPSSTIAIAESKQGVKVEITPDIDTDDRIMVASGNTEFANTRAVNMASIGNLKITNTAVAASVTDSKADPHGPDGKTQWKLGTDPAKVDSTKTGLVITGGQFAASVASPGKVELADVSSAYTSKTSVIATDSETVSIPLSDSTLSGSTGLTALTGGANIFIVADGKTAINTVENAPIAQLTIAYVTTTYQATTFPAVELKRIKQDGTRCTIYNVPDPTASDIVAVRITNDSGVDGVVNATLYDGTGAEVFASQPLNAGTAIKAGATLAVFGADLIKLGTWKGRGVLVLTTTLPKLEVLGLLREAGDNAAPLTNLSTGVTGDGCTN